MVIDFILNLLVVYAAPIPLWLIFFHILAKKGRINQKAVYSVLYLTWVILTVLVFRYEFNISNYQFSKNIILQTIGYVLILFALIIDILVLKNLGIKRLLCFSEAKKDDKKNTLVTSGIYRYARHPRYVEYFLWFLGLGLVFNYYSLIIFSIYILISFLVSTYFEEAELVKRFGNLYKIYQIKVPRFFIRIK